MSGAAAARDHGPLRGQSPLADSAAYAGCAIALCASLWALLDQRACGACEAVTLLSGGPVLPALGVAWYSLLFILLLRRGLRAPAVQLVCAGAGVHLALVGYMLLTAELCAPCIIAALGAFLMAALLLAQTATAQLRPRLALVLAAATGAGLLLAAVHAQSGFQLQRELQRALQAAREAAPLAPGETAVVWFSREDCSRCEAFRIEILPQLEAQYGGQVRIVEQTAGPGIPAPTVVVRGRRETLLYPNPSLAGLRRVIDEELGKKAQPVAATLLSPFPA